MSLEPCTMCRSGRIECAACVGMGDVACEACSGTGAQEFLDRGGAGRARDGDDCPTRGGVLPGDPARTPPASPMRGATRRARSVHRPVRAAVDASAAATLAGPGRAAAPAAGC